MDPSRPPDAPASSVAERSVSVLQRLVVGYFLLLFAFVGVARAPMLARSERGQQGSLIAAATLSIHASTQARASRSGQRVGSIAVENEKRVERGRSEPGLQDEPALAAVVACNCEIIAEAAVSAKIAVTATPFTPSESYAFLSRARAPPAAA